MELQMLMQHHSIRAQRSVCRWHNVLFLVGSFPEFVLVSTVVRIQLSSHFPVKGYWVKSFLSTVHKFRADSFSL